MSKKSGKTIGVSDEVYATLKRECQKQIKEKGEPCSFDRLIRRVFRKSGIKIEVVKK